MTPPWTPVSDNDPSWNAEPSDSAFQENAFQNDAFQMDPNVTEWTPVENDPVSM
jgi:hypothetical protein